METRQRRVVGAVWIGVAVLIATTIESTVPTTAVDVLRVLVILLALFLAGVYLLDPWDVLDRRFG